MATPGDRQLFGETPVRAFKEAVLTDIRERGDEFDPSVGEHIPREMFVMSVFARHDLFFPTLHVERAFARRIERDGSKYRELHVPMVGKPVNLHLQPPNTKEEGPLVTRPAFEIVNGDVCVFIELDGTDASLIEDVTARILERIDADQVRVRKEVSHLREMAIDTARTVYRRQTRRHLM